MVILARDSTISYAEFLSNSLRKTSVGHIYDRKHATSFQKISLSCTVRENSKLINLQFDCV